MRTKRYAQPKDERRKNGPIERIKADPDAWQDALRWADGDASRLQVEPDGTVTVRNAPVRPIRKINSPFKE